MNLQLKNSKTRWIDIDGVSQFYIDYPSIESGQVEKLKAISYEMVLLAPKIVDCKNADEINDLMNSLSAEIRAKFLILNERLYKLTIKFCVKDWKGVNDESGNPVKIKLRNRELDDKQWEQLISCLKIEDLEHIYDCITTEIILDDIDKKK